MTLPTRPDQPIISVHSATNDGDVYLITLNDGTVLWVPKNTANADCLRLEAWADASNVTL